MKTVPLSTGPLGEWSANFRRLLRGRPSWSADREFDYYNVNERVIREHRERQEQHEREAFFSGLRTMRGMGLLDTAMVRGTSVLDIGAGECHLAEAIAQCGARETWAVDAVPKQIWAAAERYGGRPSLRFLVAAADDLPFEGEVFDLVVAHLVLHHIEPLEPLLKELVRVIRPGGRFVCAEPTPFVGALTHQKISANEAAISPRRIVAAAKEAGFEQVDVRFHWDRLETSRLGPFSPGYVVTATKPGAVATPSEVALRRPLERMALPGLELDSGCKLIDLVRKQEREISASLSQ